MPTVKQTVRDLLQSIGAAERQDSTAAENASDDASAAVRELPANEVMAALRAELGAASASRRRRAVLLLTALPKTPDVVDALERLLSDRDARVRHWVLQTVLQSKLTALAPALNKIMIEDSDLWCRVAAIAAAGALLDPANVPALVQVAQTAPDVQEAAMDALARYGHPTGVRHLRAKMREPAARVDLTGLSYADRRTISDHEQSRILAAWPLAQQGDQEAAQLLVDALVRLAPHRDLAPAAVRAAQAVCDIRKWPFRGTTAEIKKTLKRLALAAPASPAPRATRKVRASSASGRQRKKPTRKPR